MWLGLGQDCREKDRYDGSEYISCAVNGNMVKHWKEKHACFAGYITPADSRLYQGCRMCNLEKNS